MERERDTLAEAIEVLTPDPAPEPDQDARAESVSPVPANQGSEGERLKAVFYICDHCGDWSECELVETCEVCEKGTIRPVPAIPDSAALASTHTEGERGACETCGSDDPATPGVLADRGSSRHGVDCPDPFHDAVPSVPQHQAPKTRRARVE